MICRLCPRRCNALRTDDFNEGGFCKQTLSPKIARAGLHFWEEPSISGKNGSGTVFFSGCSLSCIYCQNFDVSHNGYGKTVSVKRLAEIFKELEEKGANNINLVSPTHYALAVKEALDIYRPSVPVIYNSSGYDSVKTLKMLEGYIDIFLMDIKYLSGDRALEFSSAYDYPEVVTSAVKECIRQQPENIFSGGLMKKGVIIRHLILPQATNEAIRVFDWVRENAPGAFFSIMSQYTPFGEAKTHPVINRRITKREYNKVLDYIMSFDFENIYIQERESSGEQYIPDFNCEGV